MNKVEMALEEIAAWLFECTDDNARLEFGIWSREDYPHTYYAVVKVGDQVYGEESYGSQTIGDALEELCEGLRDN